MMLAIKRGSAVSMGETAQSEQQGKTGEYGEQVLLAIAVLAVLWNLYCFT